MTFSPVVYLVSAHFFLAAVRGMVLDPDVESHTWPMGSVINLNCSHDYPVEWIVPSANFLVSQENVRSEDGELEIVNPTYVNVGLYTCRSTEGPPTEQSIYVYVRDLEHLLVADDYNHLFLPASDTLTLPCKPSFPEVIVSLPEMADESIKGYDSRAGFTIEQVEDDVTCVGQYKGLSHEAVFFIDTEHHVDDLPQPEIKLVLAGTEKQRVLAGKEVALICSVEAPVGFTSFHLGFLNIPDDNVRFELKNYSITTQNGHNVGSTKLIIHGVRKQDEGNYTCSINNESGGKTTSFPLKVYDETPFIKLTRNGSDQVLVKPGQEKVTLTANLDAYPQPSIAWYIIKPGHPITKLTSDDHRLKFSIDMQTVSLTLVKPVATDTGKYLVIATPQRKTQAINEDHSVAFNVTVEGEPVVKLMSFNTSHHEDNLLRPLLKNSTHHFLCTVYAIPKPEVFFQFIPCSTPEECNKTPPKTTHRPKCTNEGHVTNCTIRFHYFSQPGNLTCAASNILTGSYYVVEHIYINMTEVAGDFAIENVGGEELISELDQVELKCGASRSVYSEMPQWDYTLNQSRSFPLTGKRGPVVKELVTPYTFWSTLIIKPSQSPLFHQVGHYKYTCITFDRKGRKRSVIQPITVQASQETVIKNAENGPQQISISPGMVSTALICEAAGFPKPKISWYKVTNQGRKSISNLDSLYKFSQENHELQFNNATDKIEGGYVCEAYNVRNNATLEFIVKLKGKEKLSKAVLLIGIIVSMIVIVGCIIVIIYLKRKMRRHPRKPPMDDPAFPTLPYVGSTGVYLPGEWSAALPLNPDWEFPVEKLKFGETLGQGAYGVVVKAEAIGIKPGEERTTVAVKRPKYKSDEAIRALESELKIMGHIGGHVNIVNLLGACTKYIAQKELLVIVEYCRYGSLDDFLKSHRDRFVNQVNPDTGNLEPLPSENSMGFPVGVIRVNSVYNGGSAGYTGATIQSNATLYTDMTIATNTPVGEDGYLLPSGQISPSSKPGDVSSLALKTLSTTDLLCWGFQIANGMEYLARKKVVHGDLATRNVLLDEGNIVKLCDFGLAKNLYNYMEEENEPRVRKGNERLPIKWMSIEAIEDRTFSIQSDVWAYGVVLWELFTLGRTPYPDINNARDVIDFLRRGQRMPKPEYATQDVYNVMMECWNEAPMTRPSFKECSERLGSMLQESVKQHYMDLNDLYVDLNKERDEKYLKNYLDPTYENIMAKGRTYVNQEEIKTGDQVQKYKNEVEKDAVELKTLLPRPDS